MARRHRRQVARRRRDPANQRTRHVEKRSAFALLAWPGRAQRERRGSHPRRETHLRRRYGARTLSHCFRTGGLMRIAIAALLFVFASAQSNDLPVEQTKKNIKVLQGLPSSQLIPVMAFMSNSLGVTCAHCHAKAWESDEKPAKETARKMIAMERTINEQQFGGKLTVTCNTCHQGRVKPIAIPDVANASWNARPAPAVKVSIAAEEAIGRFPKTPAEVTRRVVQGTVERYNGRDEPVSGPFTLTIDGSKT